ncbi:putative signal transduction protein with EAL and GGDEF domain [Lachnospiraceae bacterium PF1-21]|uniref:EAL domain-containing protein n=1 Tax=Ohessyouella blattaphilus TaxID=2949333 RepID=UPI003E1E0EDF
MRESTEIFAEFINLKEQPTCLMDLETGEFLLANEACKRKIMEHFPQKIKKQMKAEKNQKKSYTWEVCLSYESVWYSCTSRGFSWFDERTVVLTTCEDVTAAKIAEERIHYLAYHDKRLDLPNGVKLYEDSRELTGVGNFYLCFNIQDLRKINNLYDRKLGDRLLKQILAWVNANKDTGKQIYRVESSDFVILFENCERGEVMRAAMRIYNRFERPWEIELASGVRKELYVGIHMGVLGVGYPATSYEAVQTSVEKVMSYARHENYLILFDEEIDTKLSERLKFEADLRRCILNDMEGFSLIYQPIVEAASERWIGIEALCHWERPGYGPVPSAMFVQEAESLGLISLLTEWVLHEAIRQVQEWGLDKKRRFILNINISPIQLQERDLSIKIGRVLNRYNFPSRKLRLGISENQEVPIDPPVDIIKTERSLMKGVYFSKPVQAEVMGESLEKFA